MISDTYLFVLHTLVTTLLLASLFCSAYAIIDEWICIIYLGRYRLFSSLKESSKRVKVRFVHLLGKQEKGAVNVLKLSDIFILFSATALLFSFSLLPIGKNIVKLLFAKSQGPEAGAAYSLFFIISLLFVSQISLIFYRWIRSGDIKIFRVVNYSYAKLSEIVVLFSISLLMFVTYKTGNISQIEKIQSESFWSMGLFSQPVAMLVFISLLLGSEYKSKENLNSSSISKTIDRDFAHEGFFLKVIQLLERVVFLILFVYIFLGGPGGRVLGDSITFSQGSLGIVVLVTKMVIIVSVMRFVKIATPRELAEKMAQRRIKLIFPIVVLNIITTISLSTYGY